MALTKLLKTNKINKTKDCGNNYRNLFFIKKIIMLILRTNFFSNNIARKIARRNKNKSNFQKKIDEEILGIDQTKVAGNKSNMKTTKFSLFLPFGRFGGRFFALYDTNI
jgi:hypothetical protein